MTSIHQDNFNLIYHNLRWGDQSVSVDSWVGLFDILADRITVDLQPRSVMDTGCGRGDLVKALRARGVDAWGLDGSLTSIQNVLPESLPFCQVGSLLEPLPQPCYDLIICIDVIEHLPAEEAIRAVENLCQHGDDILFSSLPLDSNDPPHLTSQPPEYWAAIFNRFGFIHDLEFDTSFIAPWAMRFLKTKLQSEDQISMYERKIWQLSQEAALRRELNVEYKNELARKEMELQYWKPKRLQAELDAIRNSTSWQLITHVQHFRERIIPLGSRRESAMRKVFRGYQVFRREGFTGFFVFSSQKLYGRLALRTSILWHQYRLRHSNSSPTSQVCEIAGLVDRPRLEPHTTNVDIIICVHNALEDTRNCLDSLIEHTTQPYKLILVDDGSGEQTAQYLGEFAALHNSLLLRSDQPTGYPSAANRGMSASSAEFLVLLNSDTILTPDWLDRLMACIQTDDKFGVVSPLSNTASWQSVPKIEENGDWASNPLPGGLSPAGMAQLVACRSARLYVDMPLLNGFCLLIRRKLLDEAGVFDEEQFRQGYGEEDDLMLRARKLGWKLALADDAYIYHAQSKSYSTDQRLALSERAQKILRKKHGEKMLSQSVHFCREDPVLVGIRARAQVAHDRQKCVHEGKQFSGRKVLFVFDTIYNPGGGVNVIRTESFAMQEMGVKVSYFHPTSHKQSFIESYPDLLPHTIFGREADLEFAAQNYDAVIATFNPTVDWLKPLQSRTTHPAFGYYIQGFEPLMYKDADSRYQSALDSYALIENMVLFTKTDWTRQQIIRSTNRECRVIGASVDIDLFRPRPPHRPVWPDGPLTITAMIRPESSYREPKKTMTLLRKLSQKYRGEVEINLFGTTYDNLDFQQLAQGFPWKLYGILSPSQVANLLSQTDIFVDYSSHQAMGLTAMEAMACGSTVIVPQNGGATTYAINEQNSLVVDTSAFDNVWAALQRLVDDEKLRHQLRHNAIHDICAYFPEQVALNMLNTLFPM
jgi:GT2 family glycosyltransferase